MKKIFYALLGAALILSSCVEQMEEVEYTQIGGVWAVVDSHDMASTFYVFDKGYFTIYKSHKSYYVHDNYLWGISQGPDSYGNNRYKYSVEDGVLHYYNYFDDVQFELMRKGNELTIGQQRCLLVKDVRKQYYSQIVLPETNKTHFLEDDDQIVWEYQIVNPIDDHELKVIEAPQWCDKVTVDQGVISFAVKSGIETKVGRFVLSYPTAGELEVDVKRGDVDILVDDTHVCFRYPSFSASFDFTVLNARAGVNPKVTASALWVKNARVSGNSVLFGVERNDTGNPRAATITLSYDEVTVDFEVTQASASNYGFWIGEWALSGANGFVQKVRITENIRDDSYYMTGYGGLSDDFVAVLNWNAETYRWELKAQVIGQVDLGGGNVGDVWISAGSSSDFVVPENGASICTAIQSQSTGLNSPQDAHKVTAKSTVDFITLATLGNGQWNQYPTSDFPTFPMKITWAGY